MKTNLSSALDVANYIIDIQIEERGLNISHLKLQKLLFYCQAFNLAGKGCPLFKEEIEAWPYGPVIPQVFTKYRVYGNSIIPFSESDDEEQPNVSGIAVEGFSIIASVLEAYGKLSAISLMERTHKEDPWMEAFKKGQGTVIEHTAMQKYYKRFWNDND